MNKGKIILLNGVSSSGKSTLSKMLIQKLPNYFHLSIDDYDTIIDRMENRESGQLIPVPTEHFFHRTIAMFSDKGVNLVVDQILHNNDTTIDCYATLKGYPVVFVGVHCPVEELERRELERGDRTIGQAKAQLHYVHQQGEQYDFKIDTSESMDSSINELVHVIMEDAEFHGWEKTIYLYNKSESSMG